MKEIIIAIALIACIYMVQSASIGNDLPAPKAFRYIENVASNIDDSLDLELAESAGYGRGGGGRGGGYGGGGRGGYGGGGYGGGGFGGGGYGGGRGGGGGYGRYG